MAQVDLLIRGGHVWTPGGFVDLDLAVHQGRIVGLHEPGQVRDASEILNADGQHVLPGLMDTHTHQREPGFTHKEDFITATRAAAAGGVTLSVGMPNVNPPTNTAERLQELIAVAKKKVLVDFNHNPAGTIPSEIPKLAKLGCLAYKVFMVRDTGRDYPHMPGIGIDHHGQLLDIFEAVGETGLPLMVHPHDQQLMDTIEQRYWKRGEYDPRAYARAYRDYEGIIWDTAIGLLLRLQKATGTRLHILHMSTPGGLEMVRRAKDAGQQVTCEVNPWAVFLGNSWERVEKMGPYILGFWVPDGHAEELWKGILDGTIDLVGTDHAPHTREEKEVGWENMWKSPGGEPQIQDYLSLFLTEVNAGRIPLDTLVRLTSYNPARIFGVYPRKGTIQVGSDADLVLVDLKQEKVISNQETYTKCGWTPYDGRRVKGVPTCTLVRGKIVMKEGKVVGEPGYGQFIPPVAFSSESSARSATRNAP
ncbi:MAG: dihydroorotase family protein [Acidobacteria bacterium]|nr:dihydroorotase family protein [Acidobacteriota bacterium]